MTRTIGLYNENGKWIPLELERESFVALGKKGTGKRTALERWVMDDIASGETVVYLTRNISPVLARIPRARYRDVIVLDPERFPFALNLLSRPAPELRSLLAGKLYEALRSHWFRSDTSTANIEQYVRAGVQTLLYDPDATFLHLEILLTEPAYRTEVLSHVTDPALRRFWRKFEDMEKRRREQTLESTLSKLRPFSFEPLVRNCLGQSGCALDFEKKVVLVGLPERRLGRENAGLLGSLILAYLYVQGERGVRTNLYIDDAARFSTPIIRDLMASENVSTVLTLDHLDFKAKEHDLLLSVAERVLAFRTTMRDAKELEPEYFLGTGDHLFSTPNFHAWLTAGARSELVRMPRLGYPKRPWAAKILRRCSADCTQPEGEIAARVKEIYRSRPAEKTPPKKKQKK